MPSSQPKKRRFLTLDQRKEIIRLAVDEKVSESYFHKETRAK